MTFDVSYLKQLFDLKNQVVVLTGGMGKLGTEFTQALVKANSRVAIFDLHTTPNEQLKQLTKKYSIHFIKVDITQEKDVFRGLNEVERLWQTPTILINNAGWKASPTDSPSAGKPFVEYSIDLWEKVFRINTTGAMICSKLVGARLIKYKQPGIIINIASHYALVSPDQRVYGGTFIKDASYSASKAALVALTRDLATQWAPNNIRVVALAIGGVHNPKSAKGFIKNYSSRVPLNRMARVDEYNGALIFLASDAASYMTGSTLVIDGGWTAW